MDTDIKTPQKRTTAGRKDSRDRNKELIESVQQLREKTDELLRLVQQTYARTSDLWNSEHTPLRFYGSKFEKEFLQPFFDYIERPDFSDKHLSLIHGMSPASIRECNKILARIRFVKEHPELPHYNFYSPKEQQQRVNLQTDFRSRIVRISDELFAYDQYLLPINHFEVCVFLYKHGIELVRDKARLRDKVFIDAGGFIGDSALVLQEYTDKQIYSFEVNPNNVELFKRSIELNHLSSKVTLVEKALWSKKTTLEFNLCGSASSLKKLHGISYEPETVKVPTISLDRFVRESQLEVGLIKVDLEGAESEFLKGAEHTIKTQKPVLLLSIYHKPSDFFELKPMLESWVPDYEFSIFNPVDNGILLETMLIAQQKATAGGERGKRDVHKDAVDFT